MKKSISVKPDKSRLINLLSDIKKGLIKIPIFQREFVWTEKQMLELFDSLEKGYPIGSLLFWKPFREIKYFDKIGPFEIDFSDTNFTYVLDGFQRLSTLYGALANPKDYKVSSNNSELKKYRIYYDLEKEEFTYNRSSKIPDYFIPLYLLLDTFSFLDFVDNLRVNIPNRKKSEKYITIAKTLATKLIDYEIPFVEIKGGDIKSAVDIFARVNSMGQKISLDWILSARSYIPNEFLLSEEITDFLLELDEKFNFGGLRRDTILYCIGTTTGKFHHDVDIEKMAGKNDFQSRTKDAFKAIEKAVEFLYKKVNVIEYKLLPYNTQLIFLATFFMNNPIPTSKQEKELERWFWITSYSNYFTIYTISKQRNAFKKFKNYSIKEVGDPVYYLDKKVKFTTNPLPNKVNFKSVRSKTALLFMLKGIRIQDDKPELEIEFIIPKNRGFANTLVLTNRLKNRKIEIKDHAYAFFMSQELQNLYADKRYDEFFKLRLSFFQKIEREFVESLGLEYSEEG